MSDPDYEQYKITLGAETYQRLESDANIRGITVQEMIQQIVQYAIENPEFVKRVQQSIIEQHRRNRPEL